MTKKKLIASELLKYPVATLYEAAGKIGDMSPDIRPIFSNSIFAGIAYTVKIFPSDTLAVIKAIDSAPKNSVIVIDAGGTSRSAVWGGTSSLASSLRELKGCVTNGCVRDVVEIQQIGLPVYAKGISPRGTVKSHPGWLAKTVSVGGVSVSPGDYIVGDEDGILVIEAKQVIEVCKRAEEQRRQELSRESRLRNGEKLTDILGIKV
jgi:4-hydroxy-4-methyl-2-oxoglutarate aldolase